MARLEDATIPGAFLVDTFPIRSFLRFLNPCDTQLTIRSQVRYVPDWFPGAGFKQFAKTGRGLFSVAVDGPLDFVKESLKVGLRIHCMPIPILKLNDTKANGRNVSVAASCFDRVAELADQGFDESVVRAVTATMYIGKADRRRYVHKYSFRMLR